METSHKKDVIKCDHCGFSADTIGALDEHIGNKHQA